MTSKSSYNQTQNVSQPTQTATEPPELPQYGPGSHPSFSQLMDAISLVLSKQSELEYKITELAELTERKIATLKKEQEYQIALICKLEQRMTQKEKYKRKRPFLSGDHTPNEQFTSEYEKYGVKLASPIEELNERVNRLEQRLDRYDSNWERLMGALFNMGTKIDDLSKNYRMLQR